MANKKDNTYHYGEAQGLSRDLYAPDGEPWCKFRRGLTCQNGAACINPNHGNQERKKAECED